MGYSKESQRRCVCVAVLLDLFAVALVVPLLPVRFRELGVSQRGNGMIGSVYSLAQIVGGVVLGLLSDRGLGRRGLLLLSFVGAAAAYSMVGQRNASLGLLIFSRVVVGLAKQTMTASTSLIAELTDPGADRQLWIGRLSSAAQISWILGQSVGGVLYTSADPALPATVAVFAYVVAFSLVVTVLPGSSSLSLSTTTEKKDAEPSTPFATKARALISSRRIGTVAAARLLTQFLAIASNNGRAIYELDRWRLTRADMAYLSSFKSAISVLVAFRADVAANFGFWTVTIATTCFLACASLVEALPGSIYRWVCYPAATAEDAMSLREKALCDPSLLVYAALLFPLSAAAHQIAAVALRARFTEVVPRDQTASALAALDVLLSAVGVAAPVASGTLLAQVNARHQPLVVSALHAIGVAILLGLAASCRSPGSTPAKKKIA